jgi:hypothetical protein
MMCSDQRLTPISHEKLAQIVGRKQSLLYCILQLTYTHKNVINTSTIDRIL